MIAMRRELARPVHIHRRVALLLAALVAGILLVPRHVHAQDAKVAPEARIVVVGQGSVQAAPDYARITTGVTTRARTAREAADTNAKTMTALMTALAGAGIAQNDIQTSRFSVQPVYAPPAPNTEQKLTGFSATDQATVAIRSIDKVGDVLDRLVAAGATQAGDVEFLHSDLSKTLDAAREAAMADARRKAGVYARAAGLNLGPVIWVTEGSSYVPPMARMAMHAAASPPPIAPGEDTLHITVTVGYDIAR
jgi:uncharacterized protein